MSQPDLEAWVAERIRRLFAQDPPPVPMFTMPGAGIRKPKGYRPPSSWILRPETLAAIASRQAK